MLRQIQSNNPKTVTAAWLWFAARASKLINMQNTNIKQAWAKLALLVGAVVVVKVVVSKMPPIAKGLTGQVLERSLSGIMQKIV